MKLHSSITILIFTSFISACATSTWTYDNENYPTSTAAVEAARNDVRRHVSAVPKLETPIAESVLIHIPSLAWSRQAVLANKNATEEQIRYISTVIYYGFYGMANAVEGRGIFRKTHIQEFSQRDPLSNPAYAYILWLRVDGPDSAQWMIAPSGDTSSASPLSTSILSAPGDRMIKFVQNIEQYVALESE